MQQLLASDSSAGSTLENLQETILSDLFDSFSTAFIMPFFICVILVAIYGAVKMREEIGRRKTNNNNQNAELESEREYDEQGYSTEWEQGINGKTGVTPTTTFLAFAIKLPFQEQRRFFSESAKHQQHPAIFSCVVERKWAKDDVTKLGLVVLSEPGSRTPRNRDPRAFPFLERKERMRGGYVTDTPVRRGFCIRKSLIIIYSTKLMSLRFFNATMGKPLGSRSVTVARQKPSQGRNRLLEKPFGNRLTTIL